LWVLQTAAITYDTICFVARRSYVDTTRQSAAITWPTIQSINTYVVRQKSRPRMNYKRYCRLAAGDVYGGVCCRSRDRRPLTDNDMVRRALVLLLRGSRPVPVMLDRQSPAISFRGGARPLFSIGTPSSLASRPQSSRRYGVTPIIAKVGSRHSRRFLHSIG
jgi:hypothetical protein